jgi:hypothetical protein
MGKFDISNAREVFSAFSRLISNSYKMFFMAHFLLSGFSFNEFSPVFKIRTNLAACSAPSFS